MYTEEASAALHLRCDLCGLMAQSLPLGSPTFSLVRMHGSYQRTVHCPKCGHSLSVFLYANGWMLTSPLEQCIAVDMECVLTFFFSFGL